jgi:hypothetical protein
MMTGPSPNLVPTTPRQRRRVRRSGSRGVRIDRAVGAVEVERPISSDDVRQIASQGYPVWESIEAMQLRNRRITAAYSDLSERLTALFAGSGARRDANWCTYSLWSSKSVGTWIEKDAVPEPLRELRRVPAVLRKALLGLTRWLLQRSNGCSYRCLAAGNRFVFLESAFAIALFLEEFGSIDRERDEPDELHWSRYWDRLAGIVGELSLLDPSWLVTEAPDLNDLRLGLSQYYQALFTADPDQRAELVLAGNLLIVAYEQRRVDGYVAASLALFTNRAMRNLIRHRSGAMKGPLLRWPSSLYARMMTRGLVLNLPDEQLKIGRRIPPPRTGGPLFPRDLDEITLPLLQALLTRYDLTDRKGRQRRTRDWTSYDQRMNYITNLFRSRQQHAALFSRPFPPEVEKALLAGRLEPEPIATPSEDAAVRVVVAREAP